ncbi:MAG: S8 family serine peptidase, partial [Bacteroidota bacterium]|nr:S8 family serine peptidase [Bacteroidota bacterium]
MKKRFLLFPLMLLLAVVFSVTSCNNYNESQMVDPNLNEGNIDQSTVDVISGQYIVVFKQTSTKSMKFTAENDYAKRQEIMHQEITEFLSKKNISEENLKNIYSNSIHGFCVNLSDNELANLKKDKTIAYIEEDRIIMLKKPVPDEGDDPPSGQTVPYGITRVNGGVSGSGLTAWIIDSGIDLDHPDLNVDVARSVTFVERTKDADDQNGHGTHVAGTIAAIDNDFGVIGVAAGATVVAVRVLDRRGSGTYSGVIAGIDYVGNNGNNGDVANMSLGGGASDAIDDAVINASNASGVKFVLAAGNESDNANNHSPARANGPNIYTISAMDINDNWAYFSNYGNPP